MKNDELFEVIISDELTWEGLIRDIVRQEEMDPWDINIKLLADSFSKRLKKMKEVNLRVSGKFILAASILLKLKSDELLSEEEPDDPTGGLSLAWLFKDINYELGPSELTPRIPMKKKRRVTLNELIDALNKAIEVKERRVKRRIEEEESRVIPLKLDRVDLTAKITEVYSALNQFFKGLRKKEVLFNDLLPSEERFDMLWTFIPLLHLSSQGKVSLYQEDSFGDIWVRKS